MKVYIKDNKKIIASEKAFKVVYEPRGYKLLEDVEKPLKSLTIAELKNKAELLGLENCSDLKKAELIKKITDKLTESKENVSEDE